MNEQIDEKLLKPYNPKETEERIYKLWEDSGFFNPDNLPGERKENFTVILPPPNATGTLHLGHALEYSLQDAVIRFKRMQGKKTLWVPGTDHAAIATNTKVEKILIKETGQNRHDLGREAFVKKVEDFVAISRSTMQKQIRKVGASLDWSREAFTMDDKRNLGVRTAFKRMYDAGLIYKGYKVINWDPKGQTVISDDEIVYEERKSKLYTFKYSHDFPISISTTRPETKVGDVAVAVNPTDERYTQYIGKEYDTVFCGVPIHIKIIADEAVEKDFGTGALGVTPAHSQIDAEIAERHKLPMTQVINEYAKMMIGGENLLGKKVTEARVIIVEWLKSENLLEKEEDVNQNIGTAESTGAVIEPLPKLQRFVDVNKKIKERDNKTLKELMLEPIQSKDINVMPERFERVYFNWVGNLRDWCISRQLWYGHRIPVWYKGDQIYCDVNPPKENDWTQDEDTLDTWFSSALWTFSTLGWPDEKSLDLQTYHPTDFMNPGYEIIFFWVARMILMSQFLLGEIPFKTVYLHGMLRDAKGQKFSKSLDNGIDPVEVINQYGTDAIRMSVIVGIGPGNDGNFDLQKVKGYSKFANKIWNATRFVLENTKDLDLSKEINYDEEDSKSNEELENLITEITKEMEEYKFYIVAEKLYHYFWHTFADIIIERSKIKIINAEKYNTNTDSTKKLIFTQLTTLLKLLHPFMPFVTEEIWSILPINDKKLLMVEKWPLAKSLDLRP